MVHSPYMRHDPEKRPLELHWSNYGGGWIAEGSKGIYTVRRPETDSREAWVVKVYLHDGSERLLGRRLVNWQAFAIAQRFENRQK